MGDAAETSTDREPGEPTPLGSPAPPWEGDRGGHLWPKDREVVAEDGSRIRYTVRGAPNAPWLVMCAGFLCPDNFWRYLLPPLFDRYRVLLVNYRSVGASSHPRDPGYRTRRLRADDYTIERFAGDVLAAAEAEGVHDATLVGHSMGVQVALETWHQDPDRVAALALITGPYASPLHTFYGSKLGAHLFPFAYHGLPLLPRPVQKLIPKLLAMPTPVTMAGARLIRALGPHSPGEGMEPFFEHFTHTDPMIALKIANGMHRFDAAGYLDRVDVPTLVVVGGRDQFTPPAIGEVFHELVPDCELVEVPEGTHGTLIEFPDEIRDVLQNFLHRRLGHPATDAAGDRGAWVRRHPDEVA